jgi:hypothetical protein
MARAAIIQHSMKQIVHQAWTVLQVASVLLLESTEASCFMKQCMQPMLVLLT